MSTSVPPSDDAEREEWLRLSQQGLRAAYGEDEVEYSLDSIREANPEYEGRWPGDPDAPASGCR